MTPPKHIAVIGAGIAGLSCATSLQTAGFRVSVFEKSRGPAGRMSTRRGDDWQCDHGAQYFTARHPDFRNQLASWRDAGAVESWTPRICVFGGKATAPSQGAIERFVGVPRMTAPAHLLAAALAVTANTPISKLERLDSGWCLKSANGEKLDFSFNAVLMALPAPQVIPLLPESAPQLSALAQRARMRGCWALMLRYDAPVDLPFDAAFVNDGPLRWIARDNSKPGRVRRETWLLHANAEWSEAHLEEDGESVATKLLEAFGQLGGPIPQKWSIHRWRFADTEPVLNDVCAWDPGLGLGLCGDWLNGGKVEGAWLSGHALAKRVAQSIHTH